MCSSAGLSPVAETGLEAPAGVPATGKQDRGTAGPALPRACRQERPGSLQGALPGPTLAPLCRMSLLSRHRTSVGTWTSSVDRGGGGKGLRLFLSLLLMCRSESWLPTRVTGLLTSLPPRRFTLQWTCLCGRPTSLHGR